VKMNVLGVLVAHSVPPSALTTVAFFIEAVKRTAVPPAAEAVVAATGVLVAVTTTFDSGRFSSWAGCSVSHVSHGLVSN